jgi:hypothetical protein
LQMAEVWLLLATEMVWWVIFALLMLVGRPVWTMLSVFVQGSVRLADSNGFLPSARRARRRSGSGEVGIGAAYAASGKPAGELQWKTYMRRANIDFI